MTFRARSVKRSYMLDLRRWSIHPTEISRGKPAHSGDCGHP
jgi:hypothetical protein